MLWPGSGLWLWHRVGSEFCCGQALVCGYGTELGVSFVVASLWLWHRVENVCGYSLKHGYGTVVEAGFLVRTLSMIVVDG